MGVMRKINGPMACSNGSGSESNGPLCGSHLPFRLRHGEKEKTR
jgi:hypothetical protein